MRKGHNGEKKTEKKNDENSDHYVIASRGPPELRLLERRTLERLTLERHTLVLIKVVSKIFL